MRSGRVDNQKIERDHLIPSDYLILKTRLNDFFDDEGRLKAEGSIGKLSRIFDDLHFPWLFSQLFYTYYQLKPIFAELRPTFEKLSEAARPYAEDNQLDTDGFSLSAILDQDQAEAPLILARFFPHLAALLELVVQRFFGDALADAEPNPASWIRNSLPFSWENLSKEDKRLYTTVLLMAFISTAAQNYTGFIKEQAGPATIYATVFLGFFHVENLVLGREKQEVALFFEKAKTPSELARHVAGRHWNARTPDDKARLDLLAPKLFLIHPHGGASGLGLVKEKVLHLCRDKNWKAAFYIQKALFEICDKLSVERGKDNYPDKVISELSPVLEKHDNTETQQFLEEAPDFSFLESKMPECYRAWYSSSSNGRASWTLDQAIFDLNSGLENYAKRFTSLDLEARINALKALKTKPALLEKRDSALTQLKSGIDAEIARIQAHANEINSASLRHAADCAQACELVQIVGEHQYPVLQAIQEAVNAYLRKKHESSFSGEGAITHETLSSYVKEDDRIYQSAVILAMIECFQSMQSPTHADYIFVLNEIIQIRKSIKASLPKGKNSDLVASLDQAIILNKLHGGVTLTPEQYDAFRHDFNQAVNSTFGSNQPPVASERLGDAIQGSLQDLNEHRVFKKYTGKKVGLGALAGACMGVGLGLAAYAGFAFLTGGLSVVLSLPFLSTLSISMGLFAADVAVSGVAGAVLGAVSAGPMTALVQNSRCKEYFLGEDKIQRATPVAQRVSASVAQPERSNSWDSVELERSGRARSDSQGSEIETTDELRVDQLSDGDDSVADSIVRGSLSEDPRRGQSFSGAPSRDKKEFPRDSRSQSFSEPSALRKANGDSLSANKSGFWNKKPASNLHDADRAEPGPDSILPLVFAQ